MVVLVVQSISLKECIIAIYFNIFFKSQHTFRGLNSDGILRLSYDATLGYGKTGNSIVWYIYKYYKENIAVTPHNAVVGIPTLVPTLSMQPPQACFSPSWWQVGEQDPGLVWSQNQLAILKRFYGLCLFQVVSGVARGGQRSQSWREFHPIWWILGGNSSHFLHEMDCSALF